jgi:hypothetical protein
VAPVEVTLRLDARASLFSVPEPDYFDDGATLIPGVDEIFEQLWHRNIDDGVRTTIELPPAEVEPGIEQRISAALTRYCAVRIRTVDHQIRAYRREGVSGFLIGLVLLAVGLALSQATLHSDDLPESLRIFFGEGLFLVAAWVGIWYPLDVLLYSPRPLRRDRAVLEAMAATEVVVLATR